MVFLLLKNDMKASYMLIVLSLLLSFLGYSQKVLNPKYLSTVEFNKLLETKTVLLIDVCTDAEFSQGHIPAAINVDVSNPNFVSTIKRISNGKPIVLYCRIGRRSQLSATQLCDQWISVYDLGYGLLDWIKAALPVSVNLKR